MTIRTFIPRALLVLAAAGFIGVAGTAATSGSAEARPGWGHGYGYGHGHGWRGGDRRYRRWDRRAHRRWRREAWRDRYYAPYYHPRPWRPVRRLLWGLHRLFHPRYHW